MQALIESLLQTTTAEGIDVYGVHLDTGDGEPVQARTRSDDRVNVYSVAKTFVSVALGIAESEGRLGLDDRVLDLLPTLRTHAAEGLEAVTLRHLVTMTSGSSHVWFADQPVTAQDLALDIVAAPLDHDPGRRFRYTGSGPYLASRALATVTGANVRDYLLPRLFDPLGIDNPQWHRCPLGHPVAESGLFLRTEEIARLGRVLADGGRWRDRTLVPAAYVARMGEDRVDSAEVPVERYSHGYGLGVWLSAHPGRVRMDGRYGQYCLVDPGTGTVLTVTAHTEDDGRLLDLLETEVLDRL